MDLRTSNSVAMPMVAAVCGAVAFVQLAVSSALMHTDAPDAIPGLLWLFGWAAVFFAVLAVAASAPTLVASRQVGVPSRFVSALVLAVAIIAACIIMYGALPTGGASAAVAPR